MKIAIIRISGMIKVDENVENTLFRLRLRRKYSCVVLEETPELKGMLEKIRSFVAYGDINDETYKELVEKRGKKMKNGKLKPFFRLHPPRGGIKSKLHYPKGVLGDHAEKINELITRML